MITDMLNPDLWNIILTKLYFRDVLHVSFINKTFNELMVLHVLEINRVFRPLYESPYIRYRSR